MGMTLDEVVAAVAEQAFYTDLFNDAGTDEINLTASQKSCLIHPRHGECR